ncbi:MAG: hypothetical protein KF774_08980 [Planctomyces sp.]|nr:hypothetical protein [Planctomyces sp.]
MPRNLLIASCFVCAASAALAEDATRQVSVEKLKLTAPESWKQSEPTSSLRLAQFEIPAVEGDEEPSELVIFPPFGGTAKENIKRWIGQFEAEGRKVEMTQGTTPEGKYILVDLKGTYLKPMGPPVLQKTSPAPGYRMYGVIYTPKTGGNYFFKLTGPEKTVTAQSDAMRGLFGAKAADEKEFVLED